VTSATAAPGAPPDLAAVVQLVPIERRSIRVGLVSARDGRESALDAVCWKVGAALGESPAWLGRYGVAASLDVEAGVLHLLDPAAGVDEQVRLPRAASAAIPVGDSTILLAAGRSLDAYDLTARTIEPATGWPGGAPPGTEFNDGKLDRFGRLWIGIRRPDGRRGGGRLLCWEAGRKPAVRAGGLRGPNGLAWNRAGDRFYLADSRDRAILAYAADPATGSLGNGRVFVAWEPRDGRPDGLAVDLDDHLWCVAWDGGAIRRYDPDGHLDATIQLPSIRPTSCAFGGPTLDQLWVTSARPLDDDPTDLGGSLFAIDLGPTGIAGVVGA
jgi:sugar lactone lactonase YvrE